MPSDQEKIIVNWGGVDDPSHPYNWPRIQKWVTISLVSLAAFNVSIVSTIFAPAVPEVMDEFNTKNPAISSLAITVYLIGSAIGPLLFPPLSEYYGRLLVTHSANWSFLVACIVCATAVNVPMLLCARLGLGLAASVPVTLGGGIIADLMPVEQRGTAMSIWLTGALSSQVVGPIMGGFIVLGAGWRWTVWVEVILGACIAIGALFFHRETYSPTLLKQKAMQHQKQTGLLCQASGEEKRRSLGKAISRPLTMLLREPAVLMVSMYTSISYSYMYICITTFTGVFEGIYGFNAGTAGLAYLGLGVGFICGQLTAGPFSDRIVKFNMEKRQGSVVKPEVRMYTLIVGFAFLPAGLCWYGWTVEHRMHWAVPIVGSGLIGTGIICVQLSAQLYLMDTFNEYAASANAANLSLRSIFATTIPLASNPLYSELGLGWGNTLLGLISLVLVPIVWVHIRHGEKIRAWGRFK